MLGPFDFSDGHPDHRLGLNEMLDEMIADGLVEAGEVDDLRLKIDVEAMGNLV